MRTLTWTPDRVAVVRNLAARQMSAAEIGRRLGATRSAVLGVGKRHGIRFFAHKRTAATKEHKRPRRKLDAPREIVTEVAALVRELEARETLRPLHDRDFGPGCKWVIGEPGKQWGACGRQRVPGKAYCPDHQVRAYLPDGAADQKTSACAADAEPDDSEVLLASEPDDADTDATDAAIALERDPAKLNRQRGSGTSDGLAPPPLRAIAFRL